MPLSRFHLLTSALCLGLLLYMGSAEAENGRNAARLDVTKTFSIATHEWAPFSSSSARYFGIVPHITSDILQGQGIELKYRFMPWSLALDSVITGELDGAIVWVTEDMHHESFLISEPIIEYDTALYYRKEMPAPQTTNELAGLRLGTNSHYIYDLACYRLLSNHSITAVESDDDVTQFRNLLEGKTDFYLSPLLTAAPHLQNHFSRDEQNRLTYNSKLFKFPSPHLIINRHREGSADFMATFNLRLNRMKNDGVIQRYIKDSGFDHE